MAVVFIPALMRDLTAGATKIDIPGKTLLEVIRQMEARFPGIQERLLQDGDLRPDLVIAVDGEEALSGLMERVQETSEVHFIPPISGG